MLKEDLFTQWIAMVESREVEGSNLYYASIEYREALRAAFYGGLIANVRSKSKSKK